MKNSDLNAPANDSRRRRAAATLLAAALLAGTISLPPHAALAASGGTAIKPDQLVGKRFLERLQDVSRAALGQSAPVPGNAMAKLSKAPAFGRGKPGVLYIGGDFCPYCAALRWPLVLALLRFGDLHGLRYMRSSSSDVYSDTPTFSFYRTRFSSDVVAFKGIEVESRNHRKLEPLTGEALAAYKRFDAMPYTNATGAIPFLYVNGKYAMYGAPFSPGILRGRDWRQIVDALQTNPTGKLAKDIVGATNLITAAICTLTQGRPTRACEAAGVAAAQKGLSVHTPRR